MKNLILVSGLLCLLLGIWGCSTNPSADSRKLVNLNTASAEELSQLPRIGPGTAQLIVDYRSTHGKLTSLDQLLAIRGVTQATIEAIRPLVALQEGVPATTLVNLNTATMPELIKLPGIGQTAAAAIVAYRQQHGPYRKVEDLGLVPGISTENYKQCLPFVTVDK